MGTKHINPASITPQQISIFITAAETENFTTAAKRLSITQPLVSRTISSLEYQIGFKLFTRGPKKVTLTPAGKELLECWKHVYQFVGQSIYRAGQVDRKVHKCLSLICIRQLENRRVLMQVLNKYRRKYPENEINLERVDFNYAISAVETGLADVGFTIVGHAKSFLDSGIKWKLLREMPTYATVPSSLPIYT
jgi:DNA-binding transcriptional LysR family regulator